MSYVPELKAELEQAAKQLSQMKRQAGFGGDGCGVRVKDPDYLIDLLERAAVQV